MLQPGEHVKPCSLSAQVLQLTRIEQRVAESQAKLGSVYTWRPPRSV